MMGLWADGWFYISSAGLLVSGILFFFLLGQYRVASEAADASESAETFEAMPGAEKEAPVPAPIRPVYIPDEAPSVNIASHQEQPEVKAEPAFTGPERRKDPMNTTSGISPAVVYLQKIKVELADLHKDLRTLSKRVEEELSSISTRDEALIARLGELVRAVEGMNAAAAVSSPAASTEPEEPPKPARKVRKAEKAPEPEPEVVVETPKPVVEAVVEAPPPAVVPPVAEVKPPKPSPDETIRMELGALVAPSPVASQPPPPAAVKPEPIAPPSEPAPVEPPVEKPRRGPVWPV